MTVLARTTSRPTSSSSTRSPSPPPRTRLSAARANTLDNFKHVFDRMLEGFFVDRMEGNEEIFDRIMNDPAFRNLASEQLMREVYERLRNLEPPAARA